MPKTLRNLRNTRPTTVDHLWEWVRAYTGVRIARDKVCRDHQPPFDWFASFWFDPPSQALVLGSRGSGKSFLSALLTHGESRFTPKLGTRILGGSKSQSAQIFEAIVSGVLDGRGPGGSDADTIAELLKTEARYRNGSAVSILSASRTSVRGPHVPRLKLDEVDEIDPDLRESAMGVCMDKQGAEGAVIARASMTMTSTWHRVGGPMTDLIDRGRGGAFPLYTSCAFEVLERCPESRSGPHVGGEACYAHCPECPLMPWCHAERDRNGDRPLAKLASGHYGIGALIQKVQTVSVRGFEADYLCKGPRADGLWFPAFRESAHVSDRAEFDPNLRVCLSVDSGVFTGAAFFQLHPGQDPVVHVFADYLAENVTAEANARELIAMAITLCNGRAETVSTDSAGGARNPVGPSVIAEYERAGLVGQYGEILRWPIGSPADSLALVDALLSPASGPPRLIIHPRCKRLIQALQNYRRAKRGGSFQDYPEDPQHPHEDLVDALRGGLRVALPDGQKAPAKYQRTPISHVRY
jgi:hypothetical protein